MFCVYWDQGGSFLKTHLPEHHSKLSTGICFPALCHHCIHLMHLSTSHSFFLRVATRYSCISHFGHARLKLNLAFIYLLTSKFATSNFKQLAQKSRHVDTLWTYKGAKIIVSLLVEND